MAKRMIQECDLTKKEIPEGDEIVTLSIKRSGKKSSRTYEISSSAAAKLEQQLVAGIELDENWRFETKSLKQVEQDNVKSTRTMADFDNDEDFVQQKKKELKESETLQVEIPVETEESNDCRHLNKGPIQITMKNGKRFAYRACSKCFHQIEERKVEDRNAYNNVKLDKNIDIKIKDN